MIISCPVSYIHRKYNYTCAAGHGQLLVPNTGGLLLTDTIKECMDGMEPPPLFWLWTNVRFAGQELLELHLPPRSLFTSYTARLPPQCRLLMKNCFIDGLNWWNLKQIADSRTLFSIHITEMEHVNIGHMKKGRRDQRSFYEYGEGEAESVTSEYFRLGRKYAKPMSEEERNVLYSSLQYYELKLDEVPVGSGDASCWRVTDLIARVYVYIRINKTNMDQYDVDLEISYLFCYIQIMQPIELSGSAFVWSSVNRYIVFNMPFISSATNQTFRSSSTADKLILRAISLL